VIDRKLVIDFADRALEQWGANSRAKISINSTLRQARSLFKGKVAMEYDARLAPPDMPGFKMQFACEDPMRDVARARPRTPDRVIEALRVAMEDKKVAAPEIEIVWLLNYHFALRPADIWPARWTWFEDQGGRRVLSLRLRPEEGYRPKGRPRVIPVHPEVWDRLRAAAAVGDVFCLPGEAFARKKLVTRAYSQWVGSVAGAGAGEKTTYLVRRWRIEQWRQKYGDAAAMDFAGHVSMQTTRDHYAGNTHDVDGLAD
jgi:integrase